VAAATGAVAVADKTLAATMLAVTETGTAGISSRRVEDGGGDGGNSGRWWKYSLRRVQKQCVTHNT
jgi:hypothetical protein